MTNTERIAEIERCLRCKKNQNKHCDTCSYAVFMTDNNSVLDFCDTDKLERDAADVISRHAAELGRLAAENERLAKEVSRLAAESEKTIAKLEAKVQHWADAEADGRLVVLPCKVGDVVYEVFNGGARSFCAIGFVIGFRKGGMMSEYGDCEDIDCDEWHVEYSCGGMSCSAAFSEIGKTVFLTSAEAEKALAAEGVE